MSHNIHTRMYKNFLLVCPKALLTLTLCLTLASCGKNEAANQPGPTALPVSVVEVRPTSVPISAEAVAQTEGAKEVEIRPRVGGILLRRLYEEGSAVKAGQPMFLIDPVPYQNALAQAKAQLSEQKARVVQTEREEKRLHVLPFRAGAWGVIRGPAPRGSEPAGPNRASC